MRTLLSRQLCRAIAVSAAALFGTLSAPLAQTLPPQEPAAESGRAPLQRRLDELFEQVLKNPTDLDLTLQYANVATELGDYEAAVTALERILFFNPDLVQAKLELGVLYFRLGSYAIARGYLEQAKQAGAVPPDLRGRIDEYLRAIAQAQERHRFAGQIFTGFQHQTNASLAPESGTIRAVNPFTGTPGDFILTAPFQKKADQSVFASGSFLYSYDLLTQDHDTIEVVSNAYLSRHFRVHRFDLAYTDLTVGERRNFATWGLPDLSVKPYALASYAALGFDPYFRGYGAGLDVSKGITENTSLRATYEHRALNYSDAADRPSSRLLNGDEDAASLTLLASPLANHLATIGVSWTRQDARVAFDSDSEYGIYGSYQIAYSAPFQLTAGAWQTAVYGSRSYAFYDGPDPLVDPSNRRDDRRWRFGITQLVPLFDDVSLMLQLQRDVVSSSLPNFAYTNTTVLVGPQIRF